VVVVLPAVVVVVVVPAVVVVLPVVVVVLPPCGRCTVPVGLRACESPCVRRRSSKETQQPT
jgi:hypothetical protein